MDYSALPWRASAVVLWLPKGQNPNDDKVWSTEADLAPPHPNPEAWWELRDAVSDARRKDNNTDKEPWIKVGETILDPKDVLDAYRYLLSLKAGDLGPLKPAN